MNTARSAARFDAFRALADRRGRPGRGYWSRRRGLGRKRGTSQPPGLPRSQVRADVRTVNGSATHVLVEASTEVDAVVVAAHRRRGHPVVRPGPVVRALLHHPHCPALAVPATPGGAEEGRA